MRKRKQVTIGFYFASHLLGKVGNVGKAKPKKTGFPFDFQSKAALLREVNLPTKNKNREKI